MKAKTIFNENKRFDLIYKILYLIHKNGTQKEKEYYRHLYLKHIKVFNNFYEDEPRKDNSNDFIEAFDSLYDNMKQNGYCTEYPLPINKDKQLYDGAHRLSAAMVLDQEVAVTEKEHSDLFDYSFFKKRGLPRNIADIGATEYVKLNNNSYIVNVFPIVPYKFDKEIEEILSKYGFIYYKKSLRLNINGLINVKKINYGTEKWAGTVDNAFAGLRRHSTMCCGLRKTRVYIFVTNEFENVLLAKKEIRQRLKKGNFPVHINDTREEACNLADIYFNKNNIDRINSVPYKQSDKKVKSFIDEYLQFIDKKGYDKNKLCITGSMVMAAYGLREPKDIDVIHTEDIAFEDWNDISSHCTERKYYIKDFEEIIWDYDSYFRYNGVKFVSLKNIIRMKLKRHEIPKDIMDVLLMTIIKNGRKIIYELQTIFYYKPVQVIYRIFKL